MKDKRSQMPLRMPSEMKQKISEAAEEAGLSENMWVLTVIHERLVIRDAESRKHEVIAALDREMEMKWEEMIALLAAKRGLGDLSSLGGKDLMTLEEEADRASFKWNNEALNTKPKSELERLCKEYRELSDEVDRVRNSAAEPLPYDDDEDEDEDFLEDDDRGEP
jgi:hypothetical protein